uniref:Uncharacterized protein n=1 Tax=Brassica oleracea var. oleracea TaxID=109376 RepID=A0A0D3AUF0_BRAOL
MLLRFISMPQLFDHIVGWRTASIRPDSELPKWEDSLDEKYPHIVYEELCKSCDAEDVPEGEHHLNDIEEEMIKGLSTVSGNQPRSTLLKKY